MPLFAFPLQKPGWLICLSLRLAFTDSLFLYLQIFIKYFLPMGLKVYILDSMQIFSALISVSCIHQNDKQF